MRTIFGIFFINLPTSVWAGLLKHFYLLLISSMGQFTHIFSDNDLTNPVTAPYSNSWLNDFYSVYESWSVLKLITFPRSALEQKKAEEEKEFGAIDYDAPIESEKKTIGLGTKVILDCLCFCCLWIHLWVLKSLSWISLIEVQFEIDWSRCSCCCFWLGFCFWRLSSLKVCNIMVVETQKFWTT